MSCTKFWPDYADVTDIFLIRATWFFPDLDSEWHKLFVKWSTYIKYDNKLTPRSTPWDAFDAINLAIKINIYQLSNNNICTLANIIMANIMNLYHINLSINIWDQVPIWNSIAFFLAGQSFCNFAESRTMKLLCYSVQEGLIQQNAHNRPVIFYYFCTNKFDLPYILTTKLKPSMAKQ